MELDPFLHLGVGCGREERDHIHRPHIFTIQSRINRRYALQVPPRVVETETDSDTLCHKTMHLLHGGLVLLGVLKLWLRASSLGAGGGIGSAPLTNCSASDVTSPLSLRAADFGVRTGPASAPVACRCAGPRHSQNTHILSCIKLRVNPQLRKVKPAIAKHLETRKFSMELSGKPFLDLVLDPLQASAFPPKSSVPTLPQGKANARSVWRLNLMNGSVWSCSIGPSCTLHLLPVSCRAEQPRPFEHPVAVTAYIVPSLVFEGQPCGVVQAFDTTVPSQDNKLVAQPRHLCPIKERP